MARYVYKARDARGRLSTGTLEAADTLEVAAMLSKAGCFLVQATETSSAPTPVRAIQRRGRLTQKELLVLTVNLSTLIGAGIPLLESLNSLGDDAASPRVKAAVSQLVQRIQAGSSLQNALVDASGVFPELYGVLVGVGEATGKLDTVLNELARLLEWQLDLKLKIREAMIYPVLLTLVMTSVVTLMVVKVIPMFKTVFTAVGVALPLPTRIILAISEIAQAVWPFLGVLGGLLLLLFISARRTHRGRFILDSLKLRLPLLGPLLQKIVLSRFCRSLGLCLHTGLNIIDALRLSMQASGNAKIARAVERAEAAVRTGQGLRDALARTGVFPSQVLRMVAVGEQSGKLSQCLEKVNQFYDREIPATIRTAFALFEPIMIVCFGALVGGIALSIFLPLVQLTQALGGP